MGKKIFVLDTNVILHDYKALTKFEENDIYLPIVVLEELDKFKHGSSEINFNARAFVRELDSIAGEDIFTHGVSLGEDRGKVFVEVANAYSERLKGSFIEKTADHKILGTTEYIIEKHPNEKVILVSKDINLRMKAKSLDIETEDYSNDKVTDRDIFDKRVGHIDEVDVDLINRLYANDDGEPVEGLDFCNDLKPNDCCVLRNGSASVLTRYHAGEQVLKKVVKQRTYGIEPRNSEQAFALNLLLDPEVSLVTITGTAGTGKTLLALAAALEQANRYNQILLARPIVPLGNRDLGFLPGTEKDKITPYMTPLFDNLNVIKHQYSPHSHEALKIAGMLEDEKLIITPLAYIRGRSLNEVFFIVDEAQNLTPHEVKTIITRAGEGTKIVLTGDLQQIDSPYLDMQSNGLAYVTERMSGQELFAHANLVKGERSKLSELASNLL